MIDLQEEGKDVKAVSKLISLYQNSDFFSKLPAGSFIDTSLQQTSTRKTGTMNPAVLPCKRLWPHLFNIVQLKPMLQLCNVRLSYAMLKLKLVKRVWDTATCDSFYSQILWAPNFLTSFHREWHLGCSAGHSSALHSLPLASSCRMQLSIVSVE